MENEENSEDNATGPSENPYSDSIAYLEGLIEPYEKSLKQIQKAFYELREKELMLLEQIHDENLSLSYTELFDQQKEIVSKCYLYQNKLITIKREMKSIHDKCLKLKKRALKVQQVKEKQEYIKQQKEAEMKMEQDLIGKHDTNM